MAYTKTDWVDGTTAITAERLNKMEDGIARVHAGVVTFEAGPGWVASNGWGVARTEDANETYFTLTHDLGTTEYDIVAASTYGADHNIVDMVSIGVKAADTVQIAVARWERVAANNITTGPGGGCAFVLVLR